MASGAVMISSLTGWNDANSSTIRTSKARSATSWVCISIRPTGLMTDKMIRRGTFHCVNELEQAIYQWLANWNNEPRPFVWRATADVILDKIRRCREAIEIGRASCRERV